MQSPIIIADPHQNYIGTAPSCVNTKNRNTSVVQTKLSFGLPINMSDITVRTQKCLYGSAFG